MNSKGKLIEIKLVYNLFLNKIILMMKAIIISFVLMNNLVMCIASRWNGMFLWYPAYSKVFN